MSEDKQQQSQRPSALSWFKNRRGGSEHASVIRDLITSDKNNPIKARTPCIFPMVYFRSLGFWSSPTNEIEYTIGETKVVRPKTVSGMAAAYYDVYNIVSQSFKGLAREEYERAASSWLAQSQAIMGTAQDMRMAEGVKKPAGVM